MMFGRKKACMARNIWAIKAFDQVNAAKNPEEMLDNLS
jgi:hypothetical protein